MGQREALDDLLMGSQGRAVSFKEVGTQVAGTVLDYERVPDTDPQGNVRTWPSGDPRYMVVITLSTQEREDEDDDGRRRLFVNKYGMKTAIADALRNANWRQNIVGGVLAMKFVREEKPKVRGQSGLKVFEAKFFPPDSVVPFAAVAAALSDRTAGQLEDKGGPDDDIPF